MGLGGGAQLKHLGARLGDPRAGGAGGARSPRAVERVVGLAVGPAAVGAAGGARHHLDEVVRGVGITDVVIDTRVFVGDPVYAIVEAVMKGDYDVLAKLPTYEDGFQQHIFGTMDMRLMRACPCPVFIGRVKPTGYSERIVAAIDYDEGDATKTTLNEKILESVAHMLSDQFSMVKQAYIAGSDDNISAAVTYFHPTGSEKYYSSKEMAGGGGGGVK